MPPHARVDRSLSKDSIRHCWTAFVVSMSRIVVRDPKDMWLMTLQANLYRAMPLWTEQRLKTWARWTCEAAK